MNTKLLVSAAIGAAVGVCTGYSIYALGGYAMHSFVTWLTYSTEDAVLWAVIGAGIAAGMRFILAKS
jgi:hypothetical protein